MTDEKSTKELIQEKTAAVKAMIENEALEDRLKKIKSALAEIRILRLKDRKESIAAVHAQKAKQLEDQITELEAKKAADDLAAE